VRAVKYFKKVGNLKRAVEILSVKEPERVLELQAESLANEGKHAEAAALCLQNKNLPLAVTYYLSAGDKEKAAGILVQMNEFARAAELYEQAGKIENAARLYMTAKQTEKAADCFIRIERHQEAADLYVQSNQPIKAARIYYHLGLYSKAIAVLDTVSPYEEEHAEASYIKGLIFFKQQNPKEAKGALEKALEDDINDSRFASALPILGDLCLQNGEPSKALDYYERALAQGLQREKIQTQMHQAEELIKDQGEVIHKETKRITSLKELITTGVILDDATQPHIEVASRYRILKKIGEGGIGVVFSAYDRILERKIVLKFLKPSMVVSERARRLFIREAKTSAKLNHPNIIIVYDAGIEDTEPYIAMELLEGRTLEEYIEEGIPLPFNHSIDIIRQTCSALSYAHKKNIVHRDIKPSNIMLVGEMRVKLMDFGLAKVLSQSFTQSFIGGTPLFMSPEQIVGEFVDNRTDIYALGVVMYRLFTGVYPFEDGDVLAHHRFSIPKSLKEHNKSIDERLSTIVLQCLEKDREHRFQSVEAIEDAFSFIKV
jgi:tetratricopeptide (TPR) repeat protein